MKSYEIRRIQRVLSIVILSMLLFSLSPVSTATESRTLIGIVKTYGEPHEPLVGVRVTGNWRDNSDNPAFDIYYTDGDGRYELRNLQTDTIKVTYGLSGYKICPLPEFREYPLEKEQQVADEVWLIRQMPDDPQQHATAIAMTIEKLVGQGVHDYAYWWKAMEGVGYRTVARIYLARVLHDKVPTSGAQELNSIAGFNDFLEADTANVAKFETLVDQAVPGAVKGYGVLPDYQQVVRGGISPYVFADLVKGSVVRADLDTEAVSEVGALFQNWAPSEGSIYETLIQDRIDLQIRDFKTQRGVPLIHRGNPDLQM